jgi:hypothetical protein
MKRWMGLVLTTAAVTGLAASPAQAASRAQAASPAPAASPAQAASPARAASSKPKMITLTVADNGRHLRVPRGEHVMVQLSVRPRRTADRSTWWHSISETGRALQARPVGTMIPRGVTAGHYFAVRRGEATLSSARAACPSTAGNPTCFAMQGWSVTIDVR